MASASKPAPNGRADRIRAFLAAAPHAQTARQILEAVEPRGNISNMHGSLSGMVLYGHVQRLVVAGRVYFALASAPVPAPANDDAATTASARIREYMAQVRRPVTAREVTTQVLPDKPLKIVSAMMGSMVLKGLLLRHAANARACTYTLGRQANTWGSLALPKKATPSAPKAPAPRKEPRAKAPSKPRQPRKPKPAAAPMPRRIVRGPELTVRDVPRTLAQGAPLAAPKRRTESAGCSLVGIPDANRAASDRIAADIAAFQARGGKIERLGTTQFFKHINASNDE